MKEVKEIKNVKDLELKKLKKGDTIKIGGDIIKIKDVKSF